MNFEDVTVCIEELILHGFEPRDRYAIAVALEREFARLFTENEIPPSLLKGGDVIHVDAGGFEVSPGGTPEAVGAQVAQAIYGGLNR